MKDDLDWMTAEDAMRRALARKRLPEKPKEWCAEASHSQRDHERRSELINRELDSITHEYGLCRWAFFLLEDYATRDLRQVHSRAVYAAFEYVGETPPDVAERDVLARALCTAIKPLAESLGLPLDDTNGALETRNARYQAFAESLGDCTPHELGPLEIIPQGGELHTRNTNEIFSLDDRFIGHLRTQYGKAGQELADTVERDSRKRAETSEMKKRWELWVDTDNTIAARWAPILARVLWLDRVKAQLELENAPRYNLERVMVGGDDYSKVPRVLGAVSWSLGGAGEEDEAMPVEVDGDKYTGAPTLARYTSRSFGLLPDSKQAAQQHLPLEFSEEAPFALQAMRDAQFVLSPNAGKAALFMLVTGQTGGLVYATLGEFTRELWPGQNRYQKRDYQRAALALSDLRPAHVVFPDNTNAPLFDIRGPNKPEDADPEQLVGWAIGRHVLATINQSFPTFKGEFIINLTGAMRLSGNEAARLRGYILACGLWNDAHNPKTGRFDPAYLRSFTPEEWAAATNALSSSAVDYLEEHNPKKRQKLYRDRRRAQKDLEALQDNHALVTLEGTKKKGFKVLPPPALLEAFEMIRAGYKRPKD